MLDRIDSNSAHSREGGNPADGKEIFMKRWSPLSRGQRVVVANAI
jgi:hypothetical protein